MAENNTALDDIYCDLDEVHGEALYEGTNSLREIVVHALSRLPTEVYEDLMHGERPVHFFGLGAHQWGVALRWHVPYRRAISQAHTRWRSSCSAVSCAPCHPKRPCSPSLTNWLTSISGIQGFMRCPSAISPRKKPKSGPTTLQLSGSDLGRRIWHGNGPRSFQPASTPASTVQRGVRISREIVSAIPERDDRRACFGFQIASARWQA